MNSAASRPGFRAPFRACERLGACPAVHARVRASPRRLARGSWPASVLVLALAGAGLTPMGGTATPRVAAVVSVASAAASTSVAPAAATLASAASAATASASAAVSPAGDPSGAAPGLAPMPADSSVSGRVRDAAGRMLSYRATAGSLPARDDRGEALGDVAFTAYVLQDAGPPERRPVTFAFNGGPGASSVFLHLGAMGPRLLRFATPGDVPSDPVALEDNPWTWLAFTDLVFVDPVGTGYGRARVEAARAAPAFWGVEQDVRYLARFVMQWLVAHDRVASPKYLVGESYSGIRVPKIAYRLQKTEGVGVSGIVLLSPALDAAMTASPDISPLPWVARLPSMAAARLEREGALDEAAMRDVEAYARGEYLHDLMAGRSDPAAIDRAARKVAGLIGLDPQLVRRLGARVNNFTFTREVLRDEGRFVSAYDTAVTNYDPFPHAAEREGDDAILQGSLAPLTTAIVDYTRRVLGWRPEGEYVTLNIPLNRGWQDDGGPESSVKELRKAMALDGRLRVLVAHGYTDVRTPYFASRLVIDQIPPMGDAARLQFAVYPGGHMFYSRPESARRFHDDVRAVYGLDVAGGQP